ncbi:MAG: hypothetical protein DMD69_16450 [Gemmatimonadetes bacterium]|nr:MAG: hypothetical protein DMD69_16450 [Gemmatimonadota bacterium]
MSSGSTVSHGLSRLQRAGRRRARPRAGRRPHHRAHPLRHRAGGNPRAVRRLRPGARLAGAPHPRKSRGQRRRPARPLVRSPLLRRLAELKPGGVDLGPRLADLGAKLVSWIGSSAFGLIGTATRLALNLVISLFGLFYLLLRPQATWDAVRPYIPFSARNTEKLRQRFRDVTTSTLIGTGLTAAIQGALVGLGFWLVGLPNAVFWGVVTMVFAILPVVGSGMVWGPGAIALLLDHRPLPAFLLALGGLGIVGNVDYIIRPMVFRRWADIHPLVTLIGALAGVPFFGILGLLIGPLALSYFFELIKMYREEYLT